MFMYKFLVLSEVIVYKLVGMYTIPAGTGCNYYKNS